MERYIWQQGGDYSLRVPHRGPLRDWLARSAHAPATGRVLAVAQGLEPTLEVVTAAAAADAGEKRGCAPVSLEPFPATPLWPANFVSQ